MPLSPLQWLRPSSRHLLLYLGRCLHYPFHYLYHLISSSHSIPLLPELSLRTHVVRSRVIASCHCQSSHHYLHTMTREVAPINDMSCHIAIGDDSRMMRYALHVFASDRSLCRRFLSTEFREIVVMVMLCYVMLMSHIALSVADECLREHKAATSLHWP